MIKQKYSDAKKYAGYQTEEDTKPRYMLVRMEACDAEKPKCKRVRIKTLAEQVAEIDACYW